MKKLKKKKTKKQMTTPSLKVIEPRKKSNTALYTREEQPTYITGSTQQSLFHQSNELIVTDSSLGYNPHYDPRPFTDFSKVSPRTDLSALNLNWREQDLPESERTKHVHRLHPYLGKFIPQLVEIFLRKFQPTVVCDPFSGSGTTLVEAVALGVDCVGCDISAFNCLLAKVKTDKYDLKKLEGEIRSTLEHLNRSLKTSLFTKEAFQGETDNEYLRQWFHPNALNEILCFRSLLNNYDYQDVLKIILCRAARSARLTTHFDLDFPKRPQTEPYYCYKHGRICQPTQNALQFLNRYALDTLKRIKEFSAIAKKVKVKILNQDARFAMFPKFELIVTSPPYVGLIDYHEQHRYAYELLNLPSKAEHEIGAAFKGNSNPAKRKYVEEISQVFKNCRQYLRKNGTVVIIVNDKENLYNSIANQTGFRIENRLKRHVNRRTGRRSGDFFEEVLIWKRDD